jgi:hypothetical protein
MQPERWLALVRGLMPALVWPQVLGPAPAPGLGRPRALEPAPREGWVEARAAWRSCRRRACAASRKRQRPEPAQRSQQAQRPAPQAGPGLVQPGRARVRDWALHWARLRPRVGEGIFS